MSHCIPKGIQNGDPQWREGSEPLPAESRAGGLRATYTRHAHTHVWLYNIAVSTLYLVKVSTFYLVSIILWQK